MSPEDQCLVQRRELRSSLYISMAVLLNDVVVCALSDGSPLAFKEER